MYYVEMYGLKEFFANISEDKDDMNVAYVSESIDDCIEFLKSKGLKKDCIVTYNCILADRFIKNESARLTFKFFDEDDKNKLESKTVMLVDSLSVKEKFLKKKIKKNKLLSDDQKEFAKHIVDEYSKQLVQSNKEQINATIDAMLAYYQGTL